MVALRCTHKLLRRLRKTPADDAPVSSTLLGDWYVNVLSAYGNAIREELQAMTDIVFARTTNRSILGTMNDFDRMLDAAPGQSLTSAALELAEAPCGPIAMESPDRATRKLFANPDLDWGLIQFPKPEAR
jgi:hypothetical protein